MHTKKQGSKNKAPTNLLVGIVPGGTAYLRHDFAGEVRLQGGVRKVGMTVPAAIGSERDVRAIIRRGAHCRTLHAAVVGCAVSHLNGGGKDRRHFGAGMDIETVDIAGGGVRGFRLFARFSREVGEFQRVAPARDGVGGRIVHVAGVLVAGVVRAHDLQHLRRQDPAGVLIVIEPGRHVAARLLVVGPTRALRAYYSKRSYVFAL